MGSVFFKLLSVFAEFYAKQVIGKYNVLIIKGRSVTRSLF